MWRWIAKITSILFGIWSILFLAFEIVLGPYGLRYEGPWFSYSLAGEACSVFRPSVLERFVNFLCVGGVYLGFWYAGIGRTFKQVLSWASGALVFGSLLLCLEVVLYGRFLGEYSLSVLQAADALIAVLIMGLPVFVCAFLWRHRPPG